MKNIIYVLIGLTLCIACKKDWLDAKPSVNLVVPSTIADFQALIDNNLFTSNAPAVGELSSDDFYLKDANWQALPQVQQKNAYIWAKDVFGGLQQNDWNTPYSQVFYSNVVIDGISKIERTGANRDSYDNVLGNALFLRSMAFFNLVNHYAMPFDVNTSTSDLGIPLRLNANVNEISRRGNVMGVYQQIRNDLRKAVRILPITPLYKTRASKPATYAFLSRVELMMGDFNQSKLYADSCLTLYSSLIDFNTINQTTTSNPLPMYSQEVMFHSVLAFWHALRAANLNVAPELYQQYSTNDLRRTTWFTTLNGNLTIRGNYSGSTTVFAGLAVNEVYMNRAECLARSGQVSLALADLNAVLIKRYKTGTFVPATANTTDEALNLIISERRKELVYQGIRWLDLRRLNKDVRFSKTLSRTVNGITYTLPPNDVRYALPIPEIEVLHYGLEQNPR